MRRRPLPASTRAFAPILALTLLATTGIAAPPGGASPKEASTARALDTGAPPPLLAAPSGPSPLGDSLVEVALVLTGIARDEGIDLDRVACRWNPTTRRVDVQLSVDTALWRLTPYLMVAAGQTHIQRTEEGREVRFPVLAAPLSPAAVAGGSARLVDALSHPGLRERRIHVDPPGDDHPAGFRLSARLPLAQLVALRGRVARELGSAGIAEVEILEPLTKAPRVRLSGVWTAPGGKAPPRASPESFEELPDWAAASRTLEASALPPRRLRVVELPDGKVYLSR